MFEMLKYNCSVILVTGEVTASPSATLDIRLQADSRREVAATASKCGI